MTARAVAGAKIKREDRTMVNRLLLTVFISVLRNCDSVSMVFGGMDSTPQGKKAEKSEKLKITQRKHKKDGLRNWIKINDALQ